MIDNNNSNMINLQARDDFNKARSKATISNILHTLTPERQELLSLGDIRKLIKPKSETYIGMKTVDIDLIIGSEGRYKDFNSTFLPKKEFIRNRWESIDKAHLKSVILPPIKLYEIGGSYFVRDGNHRVSVAKMQGVMSIDAEIIRLDTEIPLNPGMTLKKIEEAIIKYEKEHIYLNTELGAIIPAVDLNFTAPGRFYEVLRHIQGHKYFLNESSCEEISFIDAGKSWYKNLYIPIIYLVRDEKILGRFPGRTESDLYMWIIKHWDELKSLNGNNFSLQDAAISFSYKYGKSYFQQVFTLLKRIVKIK
ncbi:MAG: transcriptional regulator [Spirochaetes bacterium]|nr:MAG: transcriptional regulator [Spirochaetota bacterium]